MDPEDAVKKQYRNRGIAIGGAVGFVLGAAVAGVVAFVVSPSEPADTTAAGGMFTTQLGGFAQSELILDGGEAFDIGDLQFVIPADWRVADEPTAGDHVYRDADMPMVEWALQVASTECPAGGLAACVQTEVDRVLGTRPDALVERVAALHVPGTTSTLVSESESDGGWYAVAWVPYRDAVYAFSMGGTDDVEAWLAIVDSARPAP